MPAFPSDLFINRSGYSSVVEGSVHTSGVDGGLLVQAIDYDSSTAIVNATIRTDRAGKDLFRSFYTSDIYDGSASFTVELDIGGGLSEYNAQLASDPEYDGGSDPIWVINITLEVENMAAI